ncbi:dCTP deaminase [Mitsuokella multacida]|uniref:dCTP deaminase n=1 Tax=Mitsuokella multacida TaxID=52226 RepID=UPI0026DDC1DB|nr:hypothetical protein [Mitsuokella multacida]
MFIADSKIKELGQGLIRPFVDDDRLGPISYDLTAKEFYTTKDDDIIHQETIRLSPGESAFVSCDEIITLPNNMAAIINARNSKLRQGIALDAPVYFPGHETRVFFQITNFSKDIIRFTKGERYAAIYFIHVDGKVNHPYKAGPFNKEIDFKGMAEYRGEYRRAMEKIDRKKNEIKSLEKSIYGNVLVIMTIFVALFSLVNINVNLAKDSAGTDAMVRMLVFNCGTIGSIAFLIAFASSVMKDGKLNLPLILIGTVLLLVSLCVASFL